MHIYLIFNFSITLLIFIIEVMYRDINPEGSGFNSSLTMHVKPELSPPAPSSPHLSSPPLPPSQRPVTSSSNPYPSTYPSSSSSSPPPRSSWTSVLDQIVGFFGPANKS